MSDRGLPTELADLARRVARTEGGMSVLQQSCLESAAVIFGVHPFVIDATRAFLATPAGLAAFTEAARADVSVPESVPRGADSAEADRLIDRLLETGDAAALTNDAPQALADRFGVHPYVVFRARGELERRALVAQHRR